MWKRALATALALALVLFARGGVFAVPTPLPEGVAVNPKSNRIYITTASHQGVWVINGATNRIIATIPLGVTSFGIGVNETTNRVYVTLADSVAVVDGNTNEVITTIPFPDGFLAGLAVNSVTNRIYVGHGQHLVSAINGKTNRVIARVGVGLRPLGIAVNPTTNLIYTAVSARDRVSVIDGASNMEIAQIRVENGPIGVGVNAKTNRAYVANYGPDTVSVIEGLRVVATIPVPRSPWGVAVNPSSNRVYVGRQEGVSVSVIDGERNTFLKELVVGLRPQWLGANSTTSRIYVSNRDSNNVSVLYEDERLRNASLDADEDEDTMPDHWKGRNLQDGDQLDNAEPAYDGRYSFKFIGDAGLDKRLRQAIDIEGSADSTLKLEGFSKADDASSEGGAYAIEARVLFADGSSGDFALRFKKSTHDWQREVASFTAPKAFSRVIITIRYEKQSGQAWFDALHFQVKR